MFKKTLDANRAKEFFRYWNERTRRESRTISREATIDDLLREKRSELDEKSGVAQFFFDAASDEVLRLHGLDSAMTDEILRSSYSCLSRSLEFEPQKALEEILGRERQYSLLRMPRSESEKALKEGLAKHLPREVKMSIFRLNQAFKVIDAVKEHYKELEGATALYNLLGLSQAQLNRSDSWADMIVDKRVRKSNNVAPKVPSYQPKRKKSPLAEAERIRLFAFRYSPQSIKAVGDMLTSKDFKADTYEALLRYGALIGSKAIEVRKERPKLMNSDYAESFFKIISDEFSYQKIDESGINKAFGAIRRIKEEEHLEDFVRVISRIRPSVSDFPNAIENLSRYSFSDLTKLKGPLYVLAPSKFSQKISERHSEILNLLSSNEFDEVFFKRSSMYGPQISKWMIPRPESEKYIGLFDETFRALFASSPFETPSEEGVEKFLNLLGSFPAGGEEVKGLSKVFGIETLRRMASAYSSNFDEFVSDALKGLGEAMRLHATDLPIEERIKIIGKEAHEKYANPSASIEPASYFSFLGSLLEKKGKFGAAVAKRKFVREDAAKLYALEKTGVLHGSAHDFMEKMEVFGNVNSFGLEQALALSNYNRLDVSWIVREVERRKGGASELSSSEVLDFFINTKFALSDERFASLNDLFAPKGGKSYSVPRVNSDTLIENMVQTPFLTYALTSPSAQLRSAIGSMLSFENPAYLNIFLSAAGQYHRMMADSLLPDEFLDTLNSWLSFTFSGISGMVSIPDYKKQVILKTRKFAQSILDSIDHGALYSDVSASCKKIAYAISKHPIPVTASNIHCLSAEIPFGEASLISLPNNITFFDNKEDNEKLFFALSAYYAGMHRYRSFDGWKEALEKEKGESQREQSSKSVREFFDSFPNYRVAEGIFTTLEQARVFGKVSGEYDGLKDIIGRFFSRRVEGQKRLNLPEWERQIGIAMSDAMEGKEGKELSDAYLRNIEGRDGGSSLMMVNAVYRLLEEHMRQRGGEIAPLKRKTLESRIEAKGESATVEKMKDLLSIWDNQHTYPEFSDEGGRSAIVHEHLMPDEDNSLIRRVINGFRSDVKTVKSALESLEAGEAYIERKKWSGTLDRRAHKRYLQDKQSGRVPDGRIFKRKVVPKRDVALVVGINQSDYLNVEIEGAIPFKVVQKLLGCYLEGTPLNDEVAILGYHSQGREGVRVAVYKDFKEPNKSDAVYRRIGFMSGADNSRNGAFYRHVAQKLAATSAKNKAYIELTACFRPSDLDGYSKDNAIKDCQMAIEQMRKERIVPLCLALGSSPMQEASLNEVFGAGNFIITPPKKVIIEFANLYRSRLSF